MLRLSRKRGRTLTNRVVATVIGDGVRVLGRRRFVREGALVRRWPSGSGLRLNLTVPPGGGLGRLPVGLVVRSNGARLRRRLPPVRVVLGPTPGSRARCPRFVIASGAVRRRSNALVF